MNSPSGWAGFTLLIPTTHPDTPKKEGADLAAAPKKNGQPGKTKQHLFLQQALRKSRLTPQSNNTIPINNKLASDKAPKGTNYPTEAAPVRIVVQNGTVRDHKRYQAFLARDAGNQARQSRSWPGESPAGQRAVRSTAQSRVPQLLRQSGESVQTTSVNWGQQRTDAARPYRRGQEIHPEPPVRVHGADANPPGLTYPSSKDTPRLAGTVRTSENECGARITWHLLANLKIGKAVNGFLVDGIPDAVDCGPPGNTGSMEAITP